MQSIDYQCIEIAILLEIYDIYYKICNKTYNLLQYMGYYFISFS